MTEGALRGAPSARCGVTHRDPGRTSRDEGQRLTIWLGIPWRCNRAVSQRESNGSDRTIERRLSGDLVLGQLGHRVEWLRRTTIAPLQHRMNVGEIGGEHHLHVSANAPPSAAARPSPTGSRHRHAPRARQRPPEPEGTGSPRFCSSCHSSTSAVVPGSLRYVGFAMPANRCSQPTHGCMLICMQSTSVRIDTATHDELKRLAAELNTTVGNAV